MLLAETAWHEIPDEVKRELLSDKALFERWNNLTPIQRNEWICWIVTVKQEKTRTEHIQRMKSELREGKKRPCCWPGCPHRRPSAGKWFKDFKL
jgi:uncharacterized protein YdeI (YjbR/CyaY-like superfamily)